jgi:hypothetical protein
VAREAGFPWHRAGLRGVVGVGIRAGLGGAGDRANRAIRAYYVDG